MMLNTRKYKCIEIDIFDKRFIYSKIIYFLKSTIYLTAGLFNMLLVGSSFWSHNHIPKKYILTILTVDVIGLNGLYGTYRYAFNGKHYSIFDYTTFYMYTCALPCIVSDICKHKEMPQELIYCQIACGVFPIVIEICKLYEYAYNYYIYDVFLIFNAITLYYLSYVKKCNFSSVLAVVSLVTLRAIDTFEYSLYLPTVEMSRTGFCFLNWISTLALIN